MHIYCCSPSCEIGSSCTSFDNNILPWSSSSGNEVLNILLFIGQADLSLGTNGDRENKIMRDL